ncbi:MAG: hypothetical protein ABL997_11385, partial [Planctomycetota bacterium]
MKNPLVSSFAVLLATALAAQNPAANGALVANLSSATLAAAATATAQLPAAHRANFVLEAGEHRTSDLVDKVAQFLG